MTPKQPIIRRGQSKPYAKATRREIAQRLKAAALFDSMEWEKADIYWVFEEIFAVGPRQVARYIARARV